MKRTKLYNVLAVTLAALMGSTFTACDNSNDLDTNPYNKDGVNILAFGPMPVTRGETMRLTGTQLDKVSQVLFSEGNQKLTASTTYIAAEFTRIGAEEMEIRIPDQSVPGKLYLVTNTNDTIASTSNVTFAEEIKVTSVSPKPVHPGKVLTITGEYVWNIAEVIFDGAVKVEAADFLLNTRKEVQLIVPMEAASGVLTITDGGDFSLDYDEAFEVDAPVAEALANNMLEFGSTVNIKGSNLDLVSEITFPAVSEPVPFTYNADGSISLTVPETTVSGSIMMKSAASRSTSVAFVVPLATFESISPADNLTPGVEVTITGTYFDRITSVILPGNLELAPSEYTKNATSIKFTVPADMISGPVTLVQHANYSIQTGTLKMKVVGSEIPLWVGEAVVDDWANQPYLLSDAGVELAEAGAKAGNTVVFYIQTTDADWKLELLEGHWGPSYAAICAVGSDTEDGKFTEYDLEANGGKFELVLTQEMLDAALKQQWWGGTFIGNGDNVVITQISLIGDPAEKTLWEGEAVVDDWANQPYLLTDAGPELVDAEVTAGQTINFYFKNTDADWKLEILEGHWGPSYAAICAIGSDTEDGKFTEYDLEAQGGKFGLIMTQEMLDAALTQQWWGGVFIGNGDNVIITKITVE